MFTIQRRQDQVRKMRTSSSSDIEEGGLSRLNSAGTCSSGTSATRIGWGAAVLLERWDEAAAEFRHVVPSTEAAALAGASEGTAAQK
jgi:hypothetical protein